MLIQYKVFELLTRLSSQVVRGQLYAHGKLRVSHKIKLYATVECTLDISAEDCKKCLTVAISRAGPGELLDHSCRMTGGRAIYGSLAVAKAIGVVLGEVKWVENRAGEDCVGYFIRIHVCFDVDLLLIRKVLVTFP
ncbi:unnamed protein product [Prunus brigantina]